MRTRTAAGWSILAAPVVFSQASHGGFGWAAAALLVMAAVAVSARRAPLLGLIVVVLGTLLDGNFVFAIPVLSYLVGLRVSRLGPVALTFAAITAGGTALNLGLVRTGPDQWFLLAMTLLAMGVFPWLAGRYRAQQIQLESAGWERAERLENERRMVAEQARLRERARIAQEMHDCLGHELSLIALRAGALETTSDMPDPQRVAAFPRRARHGRAARPARMHHGFDPERAARRAAGRCPGRHRADRSAGTGPAGRRNGDRRADRRRRLPVAGLPSPSGRLGRRRRDAGGG